MSTSLWGRITRGPYRWPIRLAALLVLGLALFLWYNRERSQNRLSFENRSGQPIPLLRVTVAGQTSTFRDVPAGGERFAPLGADGERFAVEGRLADGTMIRMQGVPPPGHALVILPGGDVVPRPSGKTSPF